MSAFSNTRTFSAVALAALIGAATLAPGVASADNPKKALNMFGGMVDTMVSIAAAAEEEKAAAAASEKCWTEKRTTKSAGKTVVKTVKVCE